MNTSQKVKIVFGVILTVLSLVSPVYAETLPPGQAITLGEIMDLVNLIIDSLLIMSGLVAVGFITWAGITWMAAGGDSKKVDEAKARLKAGVWGAVIVFGVFVITSTIESLVSRDFFFN